MTLPTILLADYVNNTFIETGSYDGRTIQQALDVGFDEVRSIELSSYYHAICVHRFYGDPRVKLYCGDSYNMLRYMLIDIHDACTIWLDAHVQEGVSGITPAPLLYELKQIQDTGINNHVLLIDDVRLMGSMWNITLQEVVNAVYAINPHYNITYRDSNAYKNDIMVCTYG